ncbi:MAG: hypothetical protein IJQ33_12960 [Clostridia bacterium]|nr:hypothetical protein [Clostridia bacterium]
MSEKENQEMDGKEKKAAQEENVKGEKIEIAESEAEKAAGGADFWFWDRETKKPK